MEKRLSWAVFTTKLISIGKYQAVERTNIDKTKNELLIFITPRILKDSLKLK